MALLLILVAVVLYVVLAPAPALGEIKFMLGAFVAASYVAGFMDSRWMLKADEKAKAHTQAIFEDSQEPPLA